MKEEAQRIAMATACGWTGIEDRSEGLMMAPGFSVWGYPPVNPLIGHKEQVPRFLDDLNAMREARQRLTPPERRDYVKHRWAIARRTSEHMVTDNDMFKFADIAPEHDAEAFLRAKGLWVDSVPQPA